jgi:hypothetical protein
METPPHGILSSCNNSLRPQNLTYFCSTNKLNRRQARWNLFLSEFNLCLIHVLGSQMVQSDALSWRADHIPEDDTDNEDVTLLPSSLFINAIDTDMQTLLASQIMKDNILKDMTLVLKNQGMPPIGGSRTGFSSSETGATSPIIPNFIIALCKNTMIP